MRFIYLLVGSLSTVMSDMRTSVQPASPASSMGQLCEE